jgi:hypothetical protein
MSNFEAAAMSLGSAITGIEQFQKDVTAMNASISRLVEPLTRFTMPMISPEVLALINKPIVPPEVLAWMRGPIVAPDVLQRLQEVMAPLAREFQLGRAASELGFVPHAELLAYVAELKERRDQETGEKSALVLATKIWPDLESKVGLPLDACLGDQKLFLTYAEMLRAHEGGLYQLMASNGVVVIERAALLAQKHVSKLRTAEWVSELGELPCTEIPYGWAVWGVLTESTFKSCWGDEEADAIPFLNRHAAARGRGAKLFNIIDSLNVVLLAHFAITAASAFEAYTRPQDVPPASNLGLWQK